MGLCEAALRPRGHGRRDRLNLRSYEEFETEAKDMTADSNGRRDRGGSTNGIEVDVAHHEVVDAMVAQVVRERGRVDILVANAGGGRD